MGYFVHRHTETGCLGWVAYISSRKESERSADWRNEQEDGYTYTGKNREPICRVQAPTAGDVFKAKDSE